MSPSRKRKALKASGRAGGDVAHSLFINNGIGEIEERRTRRHEAKVHTDTLLNCPVLGASASAGKFNGNIGYSVSPAGFEAGMGVSMADADAKAYIIDGLEAKARGALYDADYTVEAGYLGVRAEAGARVARAEVGVKHTPLKAHVELAGAEAEAGISWDYTGASAGAHLAEVS